MTYEERLKQTVEATRKTMRRLEIERSNLRVQIADLEKQVHVINDRLFEYGLDIAEVQTHKPADV